MSKSSAKPHQPIAIQRVQTGVRVEKRMLKVLKGLAEYLDMSLGDLLEGMILHNFEGKSPFGDKTLTVIEQLRQVYGLDLDASHSHQLRDADPSSPSQA